MRTHLHRTVILATCIGSAAALGTSGMASGSIALRTASQALRATSAGTAAVAPTNLAEAAAATPLASPIEKMRFALLNQYPASFGGIFQNDDGGLSVVEVGASASFEAAARGAYADRAVSLARSSVATPALTFRAEYARSSSFYRRAMPSSPIGPRSNRQGFGRSDSTMRRATWC